MKGRTLNLDPITHWVVRLYCLRTDYIVTTLLDLIDHTARPCPSYPLRRHSCGWKQGQTRPSPVRDGYDERRGPRRRTPRTDQFGGAPGLCWTGTTHRSALEKSVSFPRDRGDCTVSSTPRTSGRTRTGDSFGERKTEEGSTFE